MYGKKIVSGHEGIYRIRKQKQQKSNNFQSDIFNKSALKIESFYMFLFRILCDNLISIIIQEFLKSVGFLRLFCHHICC